MKRDCYHDERDEQRCAADENEIDVTPMSDELTGYTGRDHTGDQFLALAAAEELRAA